VPKIADAQAAVASPFFRKSKSKKQTSEFAFGRAPATNPKNRTGMEKK